MKSQEEINAIGKATAEHMIGMILKGVFWMGVVYVVGTNIGAILTVIGLPGMYLLDNLKNGKIIDGGLIDIILLNTGVYFTVIGGTCALWQGYKGIKEDFEKEHTTNYWILFGLTIGVVSLFIIYGFVSLLSFFY